MGRFTPITQEWIARARSRMAERGITTRHLADAVPAPLASIERALQGGQILNELVESIERVLFGAADSEWLRLPDSERVRLIGLCCRHCGTTKLPCYCGPEFDE